MRKASLQTVVLNQRTLTDVLQRTRDVSDAVRKAAFDLLAVKVHIRSIQLSKRVRILTDLVHDKSSASPLPLPLANHLQSYNTFRSINQ